MIREGAEISTWNHSGRNYIRWDFVDRKDQYKCGWLFICDGLDKSQSLGQRDYRRALINI
jgi:hypothetical protein